jgi:hypothetical protein
MNCFDARNLFIAFWQKVLSPEHRAELIEHLRGCIPCDHSFRTFALSAPVLYSATEPDWNPRAVRPFSPETDRFYPSSAEPRHVARTLNRLLPAFVMAAAAVIAVYFAVPPHMTFEDAIAADNPNADIASYPSTDSLFGQELIAQNTAPGLSDE